MVRQRIAIGTDNVFFIVVSLCNVALSAHIPSSNIFSKLITVSGRLALVRRVLRTGFIWELAVGCRDYPLAASAFITSAKSCISSGSLVELTEQAFNRCLP